MKHFIYILFFLVLITSCKPEPKFAPFPVITFQKFVLFGSDSANCIISFQDGNGNIGKLPGVDTLPDIAMVYLHKEGGVFVPLALYDASPNDTIIFPYIIPNGTPQYVNQYRKVIYTYLIPNLTPTGQYQSIQGDINIQFGGRQSLIFYPGDSVVKFQITLWDRAGNQSNTVTTNEIIVPPQ